MALERDLRLRIGRRGRFEEWCQCALCVEHPQQRPQMLARAMFLAMRAGAAKVQASRTRAQEHAIRATALHRGGRRHGVNVLEGEHERIDVRFPVFTNIRRKALLKQDRNHDQRSLIMTARTAAT